jgi:cytidylate kinase
MSSIIIASDSYEIGVGIAKEASETLAYTYIDPDEVLGAISTKMKVDLDTLKQSLTGPPPAYGRSVRIWRQQLAHIQEAILGRFLDDSVVCHGLFAHLFVLGVSHILRVRIITSDTERIQTLASQKGVSIEKAKKVFKRLEKQRSQWCLQAFQWDENDPSRYDMIINLSQISPEEAVKTITNAVGYQKFKPMTYSMKYLQDLELESRVRVHLIANYPEAISTARDGTVIVKVKALKRGRGKKAAAIKELVGSIQGVDYVEIHFINDIVRQAAESFR